MKSKHWIVIAKVLPGYVIIGNCGYPDGYNLEWGGRMGVFQPYQFSRWEHVMWAVMRRLELAGMTWLATWRDAPGVMGLYDYGYRLRVLVARRAGGRLTFKRTDYEHTS